MLPTGMPTNRTIELTDFTACEHALRSSALRQALYDEAEIVMDRVLVTLHGEEHRRRRVAEMRVFRRDFFRRYEADVIPGIVDGVLAGYDVAAAADVVDLGYRCMVYLATAFAGIDRQDGSREELDTLVGMLRLFGVSATLGQSLLRDREATRAEVRAAVAEFDRRFFTPSFNRRQDLIAQLHAGAIQEDDLPMDVLTVLLRDPEGLQLDRDMLLRETAFYFLAGAHTSVHSLGHVAHHLLTWCDERPQARSRLEAEPLLVQRFVHESFRLNPASPIAVRVALEPVQFPDGQRAEPGDRVVISLRAANRSTARFGEDAAEFNPFRVLPRGIGETGITFGAGMHACLGKALAAGVLETGSAAGDETNRQLGMVTYIAHRLLLRGIERDPEREARLDRAIARETWQVYPVRFTR